MRTKSIILYVAALLSLHSCNKPFGEQADIIREGDPVPEFSVLLNDGSAVTSNDLGRGETYLVFFNTSCPDCRRELPELQKQYDNYGNSVRFLLISREEAAPDIERFWQDNNLTMPYSAQNDRKIYNLFAKEYIPRLYCIKDGIVEKVFCENRFPF